MNTLRCHSTLDHRASYGEWSAIQHQAERLGYAGLIPFVTLAVLYPFFQGDVQQYIGRALVSYGAVIISFLGATHWGAAISGVDTTNPSRRMLFSVLPALLAWVAVLLPLVYGLFVILASLITIYLVDSRWGALHAWYLILRRRLTLIATLSVAVVFIFTYRSV